MIGFYSEKAAELWGTIFYQDEEGQPVEVTVICQDASGSTYHWDDKVLVSTTLVKYLRKGRDGRNEESYKRCERLQRSCE